MGVTFLTQIIHLLLLPSGTTLMLGKEARYFLDSQMMQHFYSECPHSLIKLSVSIHPLSSPLEFSLLPGPMCLPLKGPLALETLSKLSFPLMGGGVMHFFSMATSNGGKALRWGSMLAEVEQDLSVFLLL